MPTSEGNAESLAAAYLGAGFDLQDQRDRLRRQLLESRQAVSVLNSIIEDLRWQNQQFRRQLGAQNQTILELSERIARGDTSDV